MGCAAVDYPDSFPCPNWEYGQNITRHNELTPMECGWRRQRLRWSGYGGLVTLTFTMTTSTFAVWSEWIKTNGFDWFQIRLEVFSGPDPLAPVQVRAASKVSWNYTSHDTITASFQAEMYDV